jgi:3-oxoacyl-[acyl-carrier-protein] synthase III
MKRRWMRKIGLADVADSADVFKFSITEVPKLTKDFKNDFGSDHWQVDCHILHQANAFIMKNMSKRVGIVEGARCRSV